MQGLGKDVADLGVCEGCGAALGPGVMGLLRSVIESVHLRSAQLHVITKFSRRSAQIMTPIWIWDNHIFFKILISNLQSHFYININRSYIE